MFVFVGTDTKLFVFAVSWELRTKIEKVGP